METIQPEGMMKIQQKKPLKIDVLYKPGLYRSERDCRLLGVKMYEAAGTCFDRVPDYQVMRGSREEMIDKVIAIAWSDESKTTIDGFCSTVLLPVPGVGEVQHLGLTCVRPEARSRGLTHTLTHKAVSAHLFRTRPIMGKLWISNCAAVLSSLVNVALYFENVYPSPFSTVSLSPVHKKIGEAINSYYRDRMYVHADACFDDKNFVFRGSVRDTVFQKDREDARYYHRNRTLNDYYMNLMDFRNGDEVLQIGYASTFAAVKHMLRIDNRKIHPAWETGKGMEQAVKENIRIN